eukprot:TRINITY_DN90533_c0_g1_i1.p1 TRINITY_DN90533_c0_g1~~TRINITY_DN90533_c0_g1_i1.p1  ORF type:complete len:446 (+),score=86.62 TRINITY_DN90533_c0_g1_i1:64-1401(+)
MVEVDGSAASPMDGAAAASRGSAAAMASKRTKDPLALLRECTTASKPVHFSEDYVQMDGRRFHRSTKCGYRLSPKGAFIDIGSVWYMLHEISSGNRSYTQELTKKRGFTYIGVANRGDLVDYLTGRADACQGLVMEVIEGRKRIKNQPPPIVDGPPTKRAKTDDGKDAFGETAQETNMMEALSYADVLTRVRPVKDLDTLVRCPGRMVPNADTILRIAQAEYANWNRSDRSVAAAASNNDGKPTGKVPLHVELEEMLKENQANVPIILVPCSKTAPVNMLNAYEFFQHGVYKKPDMENLRFFESTRKEYVEVARNINGKTWTFQVRDTTTKFTKDMWMRTICVVSDASDWQFKGWPFATCVDIFTTFNGVFFQKPGTLLPVHLANWQVTVLPMAARHLEHRASHLRDKFFSSVEDFMKSYRNKKFQNNTMYEPEKRAIVLPRPVL